MYKYLTCLFKLTYELYKKNINFYVSSNIVTPTCLEKQFVPVVIYQ